MVCTVLNPRVRCESNRIPPPRIIQNPTDQITNSWSHLRLLAPRIIWKSTTDASVRKIAAATKRHATSAPFSWSFSSTVLDRDTHKVKVQANSGITRHLVGINPPRGVAHQQYELVSLHQWPKCYQSSKMHRRRDRERLLQYLPVLLNVEAATCQRSSVRVGHPIRLWRNPCG